MFGIFKDLLVLLVVSISWNATIAQAWTNKNQHILSGNYALNHRHGASHEDTNEIEKTITKIANLLVSTSVKDSTEDEAHLWKRLGKLFLDEGEYAEASRIFRRGAERCPTDESLLHHLKVYNAFHNVDNETFCEEKKDLPPLDVTHVSKDVFLTLDVPPDAIPNEVMQMAKRHSENVDIQKLSKLLHASKEPILSKMACKYIIDAAEKATAIKGWTKDRHLQAPTCDIPAFDLENEVVHWLKDAMRNCLFPMLAKAFPNAMGIDHEKLRIQDMFVVRYDADNENGRQGFKYLKPHEDESIISLTIALNDMTDYNGGGLFIASTGDLLNGDAGTVLGFAGKIIHGGYPVERGTRWILTVFLYIDENLSGKENGYVLDRIDSMIEQ